MNLERHINTLDNLLLTIRPFARRRFTRDVLGMDGVSIAFYASYVAEEPRAGHIPRWMARAVHQRCVQVGAWAAVGRLEARWRWLKAER